MILKLINLLLFLGTGLKSSEMLQYLKDAEFGMSQRGKVTLLIDGETFISDTKSKHKQTWRCSKYVKYKCKARATTRSLFGVEKVRVTNPYHSH